MPVSAIHKTKFNTICYEYNNNEHIYEIYNGIVDLLTTCNPNDIDAIDELNDINNRFNIKNDNNIKYTLQAIIEDFLFNDKYKKLRLEFC